VEHLYIVSPLTNLVPNKEQPKRSKWRLKASYDPATEVPETHFSCILLSKQVLEAGLDSRRWVLNDISWDAKLHVWAGRKDLMEDVLEPTNHRVHF
jgi:hypothetical protein